VISAEPRAIPGQAGPPPPAGWLGIEVGHGPSGRFIGSVVPRGPAAEAGLRPGDEIVGIDGVDMRSAEQIVKTVGGHPDGRTIALSVVRGEESLQLSARLAKPRVPPAPQDQWGGGPFSERRSGFPVVLPHDTPLYPKDCGGPLVDTDGRAVGVNIARALRVTTYALPASTVREVVDDLKRKSLADARGR
jgi:serine protease Do